MPRQRTEQIERTKKNWLLDYFNLFIMNNSKNWEKKNWIFILITLEFLDHSFDIYPHVYFQQ